jgi:hypothetical protein
MLNGAKKYFLVDEFLYIEEIKGFKGVEVNLNFLGPMPDILAH